jgi:hypothetical protein
MAGLDPATQMDLQRQRRVRLGPRVNPRIKSGDADDGTESEASGRDIPTARFRRG